MHQIVTQQIDSSRRWSVLAIVVAAQFMFGVDAFVVNVAIPTIAVELHATPAEIESVIAIYSPMPRWSSPAAVSATSTAPGPCSWLACSASR